MKPISMETVLYQQIKLPHFYKILDFKTHTKGPSEKYFFGLNEICRYLNKEKKLK